jgi:hypothetical protein
VGADWLDLVRAGLAVALWLLFVAVVPSLLRLGGGPTLAATGAEPAHPAAGSATW